MRRSLRAAALAAALLLAALLPSRAHAGTVENASPYWFRDPYTDATSVNLATATALVNTTGTGTVQLPYGALALSFDPSGTYALVGNGSGVQAWVFDGQGSRPVTNWNLGSLPGTTGVAWIAQGGAFAVSTGSQVVVYGFAPGGVALQVAQSAFTGALGLAQGPAALPSGVLVATATGATLMDAQSSTLTPLSGGPNGEVANLGVAATSDGSVAATWQAEAVELWAWDGSSYQPAPAWDPPPPALSAGPVAGMAFFPQGGGYWLLTQQGQLLAYAYGPGGLTALPGFSLSVPTTPALPGAVAPGWGSDSVGVLYPSGWAYYDPSGSTLAQDTIRSLQGQRWAVYQPTGRVTSVALPVGHQVGEVRIEDADCASGQSPPACPGEATAPAGTTISYDVSSDGCQTWVSAPPFSNVSVSPGSSLCYRVTLSTSDPTVTPMVDVTNLYEIADVTQPLAPAQVVLTR